MSLVDITHNVFLISPHPSIVNYAKNDRHCILFKSGTHYDACISNESQYGHSCEGGPSDDVLPSAHAPVIKSKAGPGDGCISTNCHRESHY